MASKTNGHITGARLPRNIIIRHNRTAWKGMDHARVSCSLHRGNHPRSLWRIDIRSGSKILWGCIFDRGHAHQFELELASDFSAPRGEPVGDAPAIKFGSKRDGACWVGELRGGQRISVDVYRFG